MIVLRNISLSRGTKVLLQEASVTLNPGEKIGLVGRNGAGKSSLFGLLNGTLHEDRGEFMMPPHWRLAQVEQHMPETDQPATQFVLDGDTRLSELRQQLHQAEASEDGMRMAQLHADLQDAGLHDALPRAEALILGLGFTPGQLHRPVNSFSGGWRMRLQLARALMCPSDLLLLDEPTNHLDLDALVWLESWLQRFEGTLLVISHDREFLDAVTRVTLHIEHARLTRYGGNYSAFEDLRAQQLDLQEAAYVRQQEKIAHLQHFIDRFKAKATKARQAQSRVKALERMARIAPVLASSDFSFEFRAPEKLPNPMLAITNAALGYRSEGASETVILRGVNRSVLAGQRIGILGANGQGKSTLVKTLARTLVPLGGSLTEGRGLNIGYFAQQELDVLSPHDTPLEHMVRLSRQLGLQNTEDAREQELRNFLGSFNFSADMVHQSVGSMSGGEKARLVLAMIVWQKPNLLLLDEPTNHLDLQTREALAMALNGFEGTVMLVSHDRALLRSVCEEFWLVGRGQIQPFDGDLDDYQRYLLDESRRLRELARQPADTGVSAVQNPPRTSAIEQRQLEAARRQQRAAQSRPLQKELGILEKRMTSIGIEKTELLERLSAPMPQVQMADTGRRLKALDEELLSLEERWLNLSEQLQNLQTPS